MFKRWLKRIKSRLEWRRMKREREERATGIAVWLVLSGALRKKV